jgi:hypothetical protein
MKNKSLKIKISKQDMSSFGMSHLVIDPFWYDLYGIAGVANIEEEDDDDDIDD